MLKSDYKSLLHATLQCHTITDRLKIAPTDTFLLPSGGSLCYYRSA